MSLLRVEGLSKRFRGVQAVRDVHLAVEAGEIVGIIGPNGAGKTTLFSLLTGFHTPDAGRVVFEGRDITSWPPDRVSRLGICRTFQIARPFTGMTVLENVAAGAVQRARDVREARGLARGVLEMVGLAAIAERSAAGLTLNDRKRLEISRALATGPRLLLLDEGMGGLNPTAVAEAIELVRRIRTCGVTVVLIEHIMHAVMSLSDRVVVLNLGEKIADGPPPAVAADERVISAYLGEPYAVA